ncbi:phosphoribosylglycinamide formyltransferase [Sulfurimonas sp.]|nr:phosphoribosylglycinamide formyltransferase [Sulfurimonas sp.]
MKKVAILSSHNGSGFNTLYNASQNKTLDIEIVLLISNNTKSVALKNAKERGIDAHLINASTSPTPDDEIYKLLKNSGCDYIFLSGYMKKISPQIASEFKVVNSHPALLPNYGGKGMYGRNVHEAVIANGEKVSGVTIHEVNEVYDDGKIILQKKLNISENESVDSLENRIKELESLAIFESFQKYLK